MSIMIIWGTPQTLTNESGTVVWTGQYDPFGKATINDDLDNDGNTVTYNQRFPGQYYDSETGLHYNLMRYYDPVTGRYLTVEPLGIDGIIEEFGIQNFKAGDAISYLYSLANPIRYFDPDGERYRTPGFNRSLHELLENLNDPRPYWRRPKPRYRNHLIAIARLSFFLYNLDQDRHARRMILFIIQSLSVGLVIVLANKMSRNKYDYLEDNI